MEGKNVKNDLEELFGKLPAFPNVEVSLDVGELPLKEMTATIDSIINKYSNKVHLKVKGVIDPTVHIKKSVGSGSKSEYKEVIVTCSEKTKKFRDDILINTFQKGLTIGEFLDLILLLNYAYLIRSEGNNDDELMVPEDKSLNYYC